MTDTRSNRQRAFTLTELMVAVVVLVGILLAVGKILATTSKVTGMGQATTDVMQEVAALGQQLRDDLEDLTVEGVFAIRNVAVPNNINAPTLLNPSLPPDALIRSDQLLFFTNGRTGVSAFRPGQSARQLANSSTTRLYWGHGYQLGEAGLAADFTSFPRAFDIAPDEVVFPWSNSRVDGEFNANYTIFDGPSGGNNVFNTQGPSRIEINQIDARRWVLVRQPVILADDDYGAVNSNNKTQLLGNVITARSIFLNDPALTRPSPQIRDGRIDAAASELDDLRRTILYLPTGANRPWRDAFGSNATQFEVISEELLYYPRAERFAPSMNRVDQALTNHVLGTACSSIRIDWTYDDATGFTFDSTGTPLQGVVQDPDRPLQWFGYEDSANDVVSYTTYWNNDLGADTIFPINLEELPPGGEPFDVQTTCFGFNRTDFLDVTGMPNADLGYTPWPSAIRVTLTLHDAQTELEGGRDVQFVIKLPSRTQ